jgi:hypothetical protein
MGNGNVIVSGGVQATARQPVEVKQNYRQSDDGTLQLQVAGAQPGQYDTLNENLPVNSHRAYLSP